MEKATRARIEGLIVSGLGQGAQFLALEWVRNELREKLHLVPFPGTLNLKVSTGERDALFARRSNFLRIADSDSSSCPGFVKQATLHAGGRSAPAYLILPELTMYKDVLEFIAADHLREMLRLKDGDRVEIEIS